MTILLYTATDCPHCQAARQFLADRDVACRERDISRDRSALRQLLATTGRASVPTLVVGRAAMVGFDADRWAEMIGPA